MDALKRIPVKRIFFIAAGVAIVGVIGASSYVAGYRDGTEDPQTLQIRGVTNIDDPDATADFSAFWDAFDKLKKYHLRASKLTDIDFLYGAIQGLAKTFEKVGDSHTNYFPPAEAKNFTQTLEGHFGGIGAEIGLNRSEELVIVVPLKRSQRNGRALRAATRS